MNLKNFSHSNTSAYWIMEWQKGGLDKPSTEKLKNELEKSGLVAIPPGLGAGGEHDAIPQLIAVVISIHEPWKTLFLGILANRIDKLFGYSYQWFRKQKKLQSKKRAQFVVDLWVYKRRFIGSSKTIHIRLPLDQPLSKNDIRGILKSKR
jgi:hypothetical protein